MSWLWKVLAPAARVAAWLVVGAALGGLALEHSGFLAESLRRRARRELPGLEVDFERLSVRWLRPGIALEGVALRAGDGFVELDAVEVGFSPLFGALSAVDVRGGRVRISEGLQRGLRLSLESASAARDAELALPSVSLSDLGLELALPGGRVVELGLIDLVLEPRGSDARVTGRMRDLPGCTPGAAVHLGGTVRGSAVEVRASALQLQLDSLELPPFAQQASNPVRRARGSISLSGSGSLDLDGRVPPRGELGLALSAGEVETVFASAPIEGVHARADLAWRPEAEHGLWTKDAWDGRAEITASWSGNSAVARARVGRSAGTDALRAWASVPNLWLGEERRGGLAITPAFDRLLDTLDLEGSGRLSAGLALASFEVAPGEPLAPACLVELQPNADGGMRYLGYRDEEGERWGVPVPVHAIDGRIVWSYARLAEPEQLVGIALAGEHSTGVVRFDGSVASPPIEHGVFAPPLFDLVLSIPSIALDATARAGLAGMPATRAIFDEYSPTGGSLSTRWHLHSAPEVGGMTAQGDVELAADRITWRTLPVPLRDVEAALALRWSNRATPVVPAESAESAQSAQSAQSDGTVIARHSAWRAWGVRVDGTGRLANGGDVALSSASRTESVAGPALLPSEVSHEGTHVHQARVRELSLDGDDFAALASAIPVVGDAARELSASGTVDLVYRGVDEGPGDPYRFDAEIAPAELVFAPARLGIPLANIAGRAIASGVLGDSFGGEQGAESPPAAEISLRGALVGRAFLDDSLALPGGMPGAFPVACVVSKGEGGPLSVALHAAGVDPRAHSVRRALRLALGLAETPGGAEARLGGRLDAELALAIPDSPEAVPDLAALVDLRDNTLSAGAFRLDELRGSLRFADSVLAGDALTARLAGSPVELQNFRVFPGRDARTLPDADPLLARHGFLPSEDAPVVQTDLVARDLALDEALLAMFFEPETVRALFHEAGLRGRLDLENARLAIVPVATHPSASGDPGKLGASLRIALRGSVLPHNALVHVGLPIQISSGRVEIDELVVEPGGTRARGRVVDLFARVAGRSLENAAMIVSLVESRVSFDDLRGTLEGGSISALGGAAGGPALSVDLVEPYYFTTALQISGVDADGLLRGMFETSVPDKGVVHGWARLSGTPGDVLGLRGAARISLVEARLWSIPVLRALFDRLPGFDGAALFDEMDARFRLEDGVLHMTDIDARSPLLHLVGEGTLDLDGTLHHDLEVQYALVERLGPLKLLVNWIQYNILHVAIRGTLWRPEIVMRNALRDLFGGAPEDESSLPLPPPSPLPERF